MRVPTGCNSLDSLLRGGVEKGAVTEFFGEGGSGKTNLCLQLARNVALDDKKVIYIDTEGISIERLKQISGDKSEEVLKNILFFKAHSFKEQEQSLQKASNLALGENMNVHLLIVDSFTIFYRALFNSDENERLSSRLGRQLIDLLKIARIKDIPVIVTTQVYESGDGKKPVGGHVLYHNAKTIVHLEILAPHLRKGTLIKHRSQAEKESVKFKITDNGLVTPD